MGAFELLEEMKNWTRNGAFRSSSTPGRSLAVTMNGGCITMRRASSSKGPKARNGF